jgi:hypothetical protein
MRITRGFIIAALVALLAPMSASAQDFVITVPVQLNKLPPNVKTYSLRCLVHGPVPGQKDEIVVGKGVVGPLPAPAGGSGNMEIPVPVTVDAGKDRTKVNKYGCTIWFTAADPASGAAVDYFRSDDPAVSAGTLRQFPLAAGAPLVVYVTGAIQP